MHFLCRSSTVTRTVVVRWLASPLPCCTSSCQQYLNNQPAKFDKPWLIRKPCAHSQSKATSFIFRVSPWFCISATISNGRKNVPFLQNSMVCFPKRLPPNYNLYSIRSSIFLESFWALQIQYCMVGTKDINNYSGNFCLLSSKDDV